MSATPKWRPVPHGDSLTKWSPTVANVLTALTGKTDSPWTLTLEHLSGLTAIFEAVGGSEPYAALLNALEEHSQIQVFLEF
jgi:hypothetical protein